MTFFKFALLSFVCLMLTSKFLEAASISSSASGGDKIVDKIPAKVPVSVESNDKIPAKNVPSDGGIVSEVEIAAAKAKCGGGCISSSQCSSYNGGNTDCRCSWFSCKLYNKLSGKEIK